MNIIKNAKTLRSIKSTLHRIMPRYSKQELNMFYEYAELFNRVTKKKYSLDWDYDIIPTINLSFYEGKLSSIHYTNHIYSSGLKFIYLYGLDIDSIGYGFQSNKEYNFSNNISYDMLDLRNAKDSDLLTLKQLSYSINKFMNNYAEEILRKVGYTYRQSLRYSNLKDKIRNNLEKYISSTLNKDTFYKKHSKKVKSLFSLDNVYDFEVRYLSEEYGSVKMEIVIKTDSYYAHNSTHISINGKVKDYVSLGWFTYDYTDGKHKLESSIKDSEILSNKLTIMKYLRNTLKKDIVKAMEGR